MGLKLTLGIHSGDMGAQFCRKLSALYKNQNFFHTVGQFIIHSF